MNCYDSTVSPGKVVSVVVGEGRAVVFGVAFESRAMAAQEKVVQRG